MHGAQRYEPKATEAPRRVGIVVRAQPVERAAVDPLDLADQALLEARMLLDVAAAAIRAERARRVAEG